MQLQKVNINDPIIPRASDLLWMYGKSNMWVEWIYGANYFKTPI